MCPEMTETDGLQRAGRLDGSSLRMGKGWKTTHWSRQKVEDRRMHHPQVIRPSDHATWRPDKMGKSTIFESPRLLVGLNTFEPGQVHALHAHSGMDKVYQVVEGEGGFLLEGRDLPM